MGMANLVEGPSFKLGEYNLTPVYPAGQNPMVMKSSSFGVLLKVSLYHGSCRAVGSHADDKNKPYKRQHTGPKRGEYKVCLMRLMT
jgi:hypothetical protein